MRSPLKLLPTLSIVLLAFLNVCNAPAQFSGNPFSSGPSFGLLNKKNVALRGKLPPIYNASGKTIGIEAADALLTIAIEKQLTQSDTSIHVGDNNPDLQIQCSISQSSPVHSVKTNDSNGSEEKWEGDLSVLFRISEPRTHRVIKSNIAEAKIDQLNSTTSNATGPSKIFGLNTKGSGPTTTAHKVEFTSIIEAQNSMVEEVARDIACYLGCVHTI